MFHNDHLGTPQVLTDENQQPVWESAQEPFGEVEEVVNVVEQNLRFAGQYFDVETGLHYNYFRDYDSGIGRYTQPDPIGLLGGLNQYAYVESNPQKWSDFYGLEKMNLTGQGVWTTAQVLHQNAKNFPDKQGTLYVFGHGNPKQMMDDRDGVFSREKLDAKDLAELIKNSGKWNEGEPVELWGCALGAGDDSAASQLADILQTEVRAFTDPGGISVYDVKPSFSPNLVSFHPKPKPK